MLYVTVYMAQCSHSSNHLSVIVLNIAVLFLLLLSVFKLLLNPKLKSSKAQKHVLNFKQVLSPMEASSYKKIKNTSFGMNGISYTSQINDRHTRDSYSLQQKY